MPNKLIILIILCSVTPWMVHAKTSLEDSQLLTRIDAGITKFEQSAQQPWAFIIDRYENEEGDVTSSIEEYQPQSPDSGRWTLLEKNGQAPTNKQIQEFDELRNNKNDGKSHGFQIRLRDLIDMDTLQWQEETAEHVKATFKVHLDKLGEEASKTLIGSLVFNKTSEYIETLQIQNTVPFSPMLGAKITDFTLTFTFHDIAGSILPFEQALAMKGTFALFTDIDETSLDTYHGYQYVTF